MAEAQKMPEGEAMPEIKLALKWHRTWEDGDNDFVARAPGYSSSVGRIYLNTAAPSHMIDRWFWSFTAHGGEVSRNVGRTSGYEHSPREAAKRVEDAWFAGIKGTSLDKPSPAENAYAAAKDPG